MATHSSTLALRISMNRGEVYTKALSDPDNHDGVVIHLESYILECEVKLALGSITMNKASEVMEFQLSDFKS